MSFRLVVMGPDGPIPISLLEGEWVLGSAPEADIRIEDPLVSRRHALLWLADGTIHMRDIAPRHPTGINGRPLVGEEELQIGDRLRFGSTIVEVQRPDELHTRLLRTPNDIDTSLFVRTAAPTGSDETLHVLDELTVALSPVTRSEDAAQQAIELIAREFPTRRALVARVGPRDSITPIASERDPETSGTVSITRRMLSMLREERAPICLRNRNSTEGTTKQVVEVVAPLFTRGRLSGLIYIERTPSTPWTEKELERLRRLSKILASRIETLDLLERVQTENTELRQSGRASASFLGAVDTVAQLKSLVQSHKLDVAALAICGEVGVGKRAFAHRAHHELQSNDAPRSAFLAADCRGLGSVPAESLFGDMRIGDGTHSLFAEAQHGTLCLRHISRLPLDVQREIVETCRDGQLVRDGKLEPVDVKLMLTHEGPATTMTRSLAPELANLIHRPLFEIKPLRQRLEDLPLLTAQFLDEIAQELGSTRCPMSPRAMDRLRVHSWPGNATELRQTLHTAAILAGGKAITPKHLPKTLGSEAPHERTVDLPRLEDVEKEHIQRVLDAVGGNKLLASKTLGIANSTLYQKIKRYEIGG